MHALLYRFALGCVEEKIVDEAELDWLVYGLEKRITTAVTAGLFLLVGLHLANALSVVAFLISFYFLRVRTNGYHANSFLGCVAFSLLLELCFLKLVLPVLTQPTHVILNTVSLLAIFCFAPFANSNMHLDEREFVACRNGSRTRMGLLYATAILLSVFGETAVSRGITLGNTMTALLLAIANIKKDKGGNEHERGK